MGIRGRDSGKSVGEMVGQLHLRMEQLEEVAERFVEGRGLANLHSYIYVDRVPREGEYIVLELGGTHLRAAQVKLKIQNSKFKKDFLSEVIEDKIPCRDKECTVGQFWGQIIEEIKPVLKKDAQIGFTFAYAMETVRQDLGEIDGRLLYLSKEVKVPELVGKFVGRELSRELEREGFGKCRVVVLNDTVATLLSGMVSSLNGRETSNVLPSDVVSLAGLVVGTGMNIAVVRDGEVVNTEVAELDIKGLGIRTEFDRLVDRKSLDPGKAILEKMVSGMYLPRVFNEIVGEERVKDLREFREFSGKDAQIAHALIKRSARLIGAVVAGAVRKGVAFHAVKGNALYRVVTEGSVFWKVSGYREIVEKTVKELLSGVGVEFVKVETPGLAGAAIAAALTA